MFDVCKAGFNGPFHMIGMVAHAWQLGILICGLQSEKYEIG